jgi:hypothetical protein
VTLAGAACVQGGVHLGPVLKGKLNELMHYDGDDFLEFFIKKFGEKIRDYARKTHGAHIRWNVLEVCISSYSLV